MKKAKKFIIYRKDHKRGSAAKKHGISKEQLHDRNGQILSKTAEKGRITAMEIDGVKKT
ncbi:hypothetical protein HNR31_001876 [Anoxybacillus caldiproteolyticus]|uniref:Uncharacterized protein n=1 Tax=Thermaerobacillus caldiproteolyticus TaxID=247480 RepID=A0A7V9Z6V1_9BACL|nr:hypothetical protein [Anoxybacillus caldiproteolyticus]